MCSGTSNFEPIDYLRQRGCTAGIANDKSFGDSHLLHTQHKRSWIGAQGPIGIMFSELNGGELISEDGISIAHSTLNDCDLQVKGCVFHRAVLNECVINDLTLGVTIDNAEIDSCGVYSQSATAAPPGHYAILALTDRSVLQGHSLTIGSSAAVVLRNCSHIDGPGDISLGDGAALIIDHLRCSTGLPSLTIPRSHLVALHSDGYDVELSDLYVVACLPTSASEHPEFILTVAARLRECGGWAVCHPSLHSTHSVLHRTVWRGGDDQPRWVQTLEDMVASGEAVPLSDVDSWASRPFIPDGEPGIFSGETIEVSALNALHTLHNYEDIRRFWEHGGPAPKE